MNEVHGLTGENMLRVFPRYLAGDDRQMGLGRAEAWAMEERSREDRMAVLYANIDALPERVLDILAYDFKVDWWDTAYTLEEKRRTLKSSWKVHRTLGTKAAVERGVSAIYPNAKVQEWFDYNGKPYHFRLEVDASGEEKTLEQQTQVLDRVNYYKNLRSHLDSITYVTRFEEDGILRVGGMMGSVSRTPVQEEPDRICFRDTVRSGGVMASRAFTPIKEG